MVGPRRAKDGNTSWSPRINASFFSRRQPLIWPFGRYGIFYPLETLMENQRHRAAMRGITVPRASLMFGYSPFQTVTGCPDVI
jgi:hypothetical protein